MNVRSRRQRVYKWKINRLGTVIAAARLHTTGLAASWILGSTERHGENRYGPGPFHDATRDPSRSFSVIVTKHACRCCHPKCYVHGNALDLWAIAHRLTLYGAALHLAKTDKLPDTERDFHGWDTD